MKEVIKSNLFLPKLQKIEIGQVNLVWLIFNSNSLIILDLWVWVSQTHSVIHWERFADCNWCHSGWWRHQLNWVKIWNTRGRERTCIDRQSHQLWDEKHLIFSKHFFCFYRNRMCGAFVRSRGRSQLALWKLWLLRLECSPFLGLLCPKFLRFVGPHCRGFSWLTTAVTLPYNLGCVGPLMREKPCWVARALMGPTF